MPSVSRPITRLGALGACAALLAGAASGCSTTQEKASAQQAEAKRFLEAREARREQKHEHGKGQPGKQDEKGS
ncbi:MAG TPA: hypothetical protein VGO13_03255 [Solirubrobacterales bacterium]|nr:hypothetical protein [Solirubrobacterales bacterium]